MTETSERPATGSKLTQLERQPFAILEEGISVEEIRGASLIGSINTMQEVISHRGQFGEKRLAETLLSCTDFSTINMLECLQPTVQDIIVQTPQSDDISMVIARRQQATV